jgi:hypothetical protein
MGLGQLGGEFDLRRDFEAGQLAGAEAADLALGGQQ